MKRSAGYTLLEMSIVLVIIALVAGAILIGKSLIRGSELQSIVSDGDKIKRAVSLFKGKYDSLPGDMPSAEASWGTDSSGCPNGGGATGTCNGNGDGMIANWNYITGAMGADANESFRAWQQMAYAGFLPGSYSGVTGPGGAFNPVPGVNSLKASSPDISYSLFWLYNPNGAAASGTYAHTPDHVLTVGAPTAASGSSSAALTAQEAFDIDNKMDDGLPGLGNVLGNTSAPNCTTSDVPGTAQYNTSSTGPACWLAFHLGF